MRNSGACKNTLKISSARWTHLYFIIHIFHYKCKSERSSWCGWPFYENCCSIQYLPYSSQKSKYFFRLKEWGHKREIDYFSWTSKQQPLPYIYALKLPFLSAWSTQYQQCCEHYLVVYLKVAWMEFDRISFNTSNLRGWMGDFILW